MIAHIWNTDLPIFVKEQAILLSLSKSLLFVLQIFRFSYSAQRILNQ